jgi:hypothetical protein
MDAAAPTYGELLERKGRPRWTWTEWAGLGLVIALAACWWLDRAAPSDAGNPARMANVAIRGAMLIALGIASWVAVRIFGAVVLFGEGLLVAKDDQTPWHSFHSEESKKTHATFCRILQII